MRRRHFNRSERIAIYLTSDKLCAICRKPLTSDWEPDHITPFARGGHTDVVNAQPVCPRCNRKKGASHGVLAS
jgi:5-methylcytosine-specific restriction endonuclease McrA